MFWTILIITTAVIIILDIINWIINKIGEKLGISKEEINKALNLWTIFNIGKNKK